MSAIDNEGIASSQNQVHREGVRSTRSDRIQRSKASNPSPIITSNHAVVRFKQPDKPSNNRVKLSNPTPSAAAIVKSRSVRRHLNSRNTSARAAAPQPIAPSNQTTQMMP